MKTVESIAEKYKDELDNANYETIPSYDSFLINKWKHKIPKGWYGFDGINELWGKIIDEFLTELDKSVVHLEIHQIKLKFGGLRFYVSYECKSKEMSKFIDLQINDLENLLYSEKLIY